MIALCCESSTLLGSIAVFKDRDLLSYKESLRQGSHSDVLNTFVQEALADAKVKLSEVDLFVSGVGPGSFTGIRISLNAIKTWGYCFDKPVLGINSLENLAQQCDDSDHPIVAMINAFKNMVYIATFRKQNSFLSILKSPEVVRVQNLSLYFTEKSVVVGDGYDTYSRYFSHSLQSLIMRPSYPSDDPKAKAMGLLIEKHYDLATHWSELLPLYLRDSEAQENKLGIKFQPLE